MEEWTRTVKSCFTMFNGSSFCERIRNRDPYSEYGSGSGSSKLLNTDPIRLPDPAPQRWFEGSRKEAHNFKKFRVFSSFEFILLWNWKKRDSNTSSLLVCHEVVSQ